MSKSNFGVRWCSIRRILSAILLLTKWELQDIMVCYENIVITKHTLLVVRGGKGNSIALQCHLHTSASAWSFSYTTFPYCTLVMCYFLDTLGLKEFKISRLLQCFILSVLYCLFPLYRDVSEYDYLFIFTLLHKS